MQKSSISIDKGCSSKSRVMVDSSAEESGWTLYFDDLLNDSNNMNPEYFDHEEKDSLALFTSDNEISSSKLCLASDAASSASVVGFSSRTSSRNLSFKKRRSCIVNKGSSIASDDSLEDTASSPVNSPKVHILLLLLLKLMLKYARGVHIATLLLTRERAWFGFGFKILGFLKFQNQSVCPYNLSNFPF